MLDSSKNLYLRYVPIIVGPCRSRRAQSSSFSKRENSGSPIPQRAFLTLFLFLAMVKHRVWFKADEVCVWCFACFGILEVATLFKILETMIIKACPLFSSTFKYSRRSFFSLIFPLLFWTPQLMCTYKCHKHSTAHALFVLDSDILQQNSTKHLTIFSCRAQ